MSSSLPACSAYSCGLRGVHAARIQLGQARRVTLSGSANAEVDAELRVGQIEETVTVTGETPIVDVRSTTRQAVLSADVIDALPTSRNFVFVFVVGLGCSFDRTP
jgi:hypothetical protein